jgi:hypothetical protein
MTKKNLLSIYFHPMKKFNYPFTAGLLLFCLTSMKAGGPHSSISGLPVMIKTDFEAVAVLELFTSQGCSSCPPADELLDQFIKRKNEPIFPLSFHVDYWNRLGWKDVFSNADYSKRQEEYAHVFGLESVYTPQLVINGKTEFTGSDEPRIRKAVTEALAERAIVQISAETRVEEKTISVSYQLTGNTKNNLLNIALLESKATVPVNAGENKGNVLNNYNVVRVWNVLGGDILKNKTTLERPADLSWKNAKLILFTQDKTSYRVTGAVKLDL